MAKNYFKSYIWLLEILQSRGRLTLKELQRPQGQYILH